VNEQTEADRIRLVLLDDQALFRASLARLLSVQPGLEVVAECGDSAGAIDILSRSPVDVVLLDFEHATEGDGGFISQTRSLGYRGRFLIVAGTADVRHSAIAIKLGASGIFLKSEAPDRLVQAIKLVADGAVWFDHRIIQLLADQSIAPLPGAGEPPSAQHLSERERKVLLGILGGLTNRKIGDNLGISEGAVKVSVQQLFHKTGVRTRSQLVRAALEGSLGTARGLMKRVRKTVAPFRSKAGELRHLIAGNLSAPRQPNG
jgi:two-component system, NarL family, nitrate/nitrite response regulator NarL